MMVTNSRPVLFSRSSRNDDIALRFSSNVFDYSTVEDSVGEEEKDNVTENINTSYSLGYVK